tara:strand:+ start:1331 stop:1876 length:546 start_codon:yes stop_codon:yes gene_type:complete
MMVIDDFFNEEDFAAILAATDRARNTPEIPACEHREEVDHVGFENSKFWMLDMAAPLTVNELVKRGYFTSLTNEKQMIVRYHVTTSPYASLWHRDRMADWNGNVVDYIGLTLFLNDWDSNNGGLYIYKDEKGSDTGRFVAPKRNRFIFNPLDYWHGVTQIRNLDVQRHSLQMFISSRNLIK